MLVAKKLCRRSSPMVSFCNRTGWFATRLWRLLLDRSRLHYFKMIPLTGEININTEGREEWVIDASASELSCPTVYHS
jgi:hypothetical protein